MPDALKQKVYEPAEKGVATIGANVNPLWGITVIWERTSQIWRSRA